MIKFLSNLLFKLELFFSTKSLKENVVHVNKKHDIYILLSENNKYIQIYNKGLIFKLPLDFSLNSVDDIESLFDDISDLNIELNSKEQLEELLSYYEELEDYEKCEEIKEIIKRKK